jgi:8-oxo-dGTP diphosphatase
MSDNRPQVAVGAIVVHEDSLLLVKRGKDPGKGLWTVPGGSLEDGEYIADAVTREVMEETGLQVDAGELLGIFEVIGDRHFVILDHVATLVSPGEPVPGDDVDEAAWVTLDKVHELDCTPRFVETLTAWGILGTAK